MAGHTKKLICIPENRRCRSVRDGDADVFDPVDHAEDKPEDLVGGILSHRDFRYVFLLVLEQAHIAAGQMIESLSLQF
jgi:hypothetical protein